jgi:hypothetical protein
MVGNGDVHRLEQLGTTYSLVDAARDSDSICSAIAAGRVRVVSYPLSVARAARLLTTLFAGGLLEPRPEREKVPEQETPAAA